MCIVPNSGDDFEWKINEDFTEITITKYKGRRKDVVIPATIQDVPVVCIGKDAFYDNNITSFSAAGNLQGLPMNLVL